MKKLNFHIGNVFPPPAVFIGFVLLAAGVVLLISVPVLGVIALLAGGLLSLSYTGVQVDVENKRFQSYSSYFFIPSGEWKSLEHYPCISILGKNLSYSVGAQMPVAGGMAVMLSETKVDDKYYDICFLDKTHRQKVIVKRLQDPEQAKKDAAELATLLGLEFTAYHPQISAATKARKAQEASRRR